MGIVKFTGIDQNGNPSGVTIGLEEPLTMKDLFKLSQNLEKTKTRPKLKMASIISLKMLNKPTDIKKSEAINPVLRKLVGYETEKMLEQNSQFAERNTQPEDGQKTVGQEQISTHPIRMDDVKEEVQDPLIEVNLGTKENPRVTFVSGHLGPEEFDKIMTILRRYKDCFAWDYPELPGLSRKLVEHRLPTKEGFLPFQQALRRIALDITLKIKEEIEDWFEQVLLDQPGKTKFFSLLLRLKNHKAFVWQEEHQKASDAIKQYLATLTVLIPPREGKPLKLYISATQESIGSLLAQDNEDGHEQAVFYLSRIMNPTECRYSTVEKLCLAL